VCVANQRYATNTEPGILFNLLHLRCHVLIVTLNVFLQNTSMWRWLTCRYTAGGVCIVQDDSYCFARSV